MLRAKKIDADSVCCKRFTMLPPIRIGCIHDRWIGTACDGHSHELLIARIELLQRVIIRKLLEAAPPVSKRGDGDECTSLKVVLLVVYPFDERLSDPGSSAESEVVNVLLENPPWPVQDYRSRPKNLE